MSKFQQYLNEMQENEYGADLPTHEVDRIRREEGLPDPATYFKNLETNKESSKGHSTQVSNTVNTYVKIYELIRKDHLSGIGLDYSAGMAHGTEYIRNQGHKMDAYEVHPPTDNRIEHITFKGKGSLPMGKLYDYIICSCVLNVIPRDERDFVVKDIWNHLKPNGEAFITVRGKGVMTVKDPVILSRDNMEVIVRASGAYQKGFTQKELVNYIKEILPKADVAGLGVSDASVRIIKK